MPPSTSFAAAWDLSPRASVPDLGALASVTKDNTYGALFVGFAVSSTLFGILCAQTYTYLRRYPLDRLWYKGLVFLLWLLEAVHQAFVGHGAYSYAISNWGNVAILFQAPVWTLVFQVALGALAGAFVKSAFALRVWRFSGGNRWVTSFIIVLVCAQLGSSIVYTYKGLRLTSLLQVDQLKLVGSLSLILGVVTDVVTAAALCWFLRNLKTGYKKDDSLVNRLTLYAVNTGILTSAVSLTTLILYNIMPDNFIFMACYFVLSKLYANSFLATLNTRRVLRGRGTDAETNTMPTFLMVGKITRHQPNEDQQRHAYPPHETGKSQYYSTHTQASTAMEIGIEQEVTITRDSFDGYNKTSEKF
ncbi:hypothetical protein BDW22DRAFT_1362361 [Trametopsis cervina]|nr:hypothetical protein BDW22DRAFT_1362361 [Trametopsis cervina]